MSEPIQSIAQNNYILATQQEVSHDNTLSGNGTVESPLGLSNETVLYSGTVGTNYAELSEPISNYEFAEITIVPEGGDAYPTCTKFPTNIGSRGITAPHGQANAQLSFIWISVQDSAVSAVRRKTINFNSYTTTATALAATVSSSPSVIKEVRGINRLSASN